MTDQPPSIDDALGIVAINSPDYVHHMLDALETGRVTIPLRNVNDQERISRTKPSEIFSPSEGHGWLSRPFMSPRSDQLATISFTSGTEGLPKAVYLSQANLDDVTKRLINVLEMTDEIREYIGVPVYHSFGYGRCRSVLAAGGSCFIPKAGFDLMELRAMLKAGEVNAISAVPSLWRLFLQQSHLFGSELEAVRWVEIGSQFMSAKEKMALCGLLPNAKIVQHYGLTEASRSTFLRIDTASDEILGSVGKLGNTVPVRVNDMGLIMVQGPHVAMGIDDGTQYRKIDTQDWLITKDQGRIEDGYLYFEGRADDVINCAGIKVVPDLIEVALHNAVPQARDFGVMRCDDAMRGDGILLALTPACTSYENALVQALSDYLETQGLSARSSIVVQRVKELPRTQTGKLQRKVLATVLETAVPKVKSAGQTEFADLVLSIAGAEAVERGDTFFDTGSDSLNHMQLQLQLECALGSAPADWESCPLNELIEKVEAVTTLSGEQQSSGGAPPLPRGICDCNPKDISFWALIAEDYRTNDASIFHQGFLMLFIHRFGNWRMGIRLRLVRAPLTILYKFLNKLTQPLFGMKLDYTVKVGRRVKLEHFGGMILGARAIGNDVVLRQNTTMGIRSTADTNAKPIIGSFVDIGAGAVIAGNITIGDNAIIGANTVVYTNVPENAVIVGVPGKIIGQNPKQNPSPLVLRNKRR